MKSPLKATRSVLQVAKSVLKIIEKKDKYIENLPSFPRSLMLEQSEGVYIIAFGSFIYGNFSYVEKSYVIPTETVICLKKSERGS